MHAEKQFADHEAKDNRRAAACLASSSAAPLLRPILGMIRSRRLPRAAPYKRDLPGPEPHQIDTEHFTLETHGHEVYFSHREVLLARDRPFLPAGGYTPRLHG